MRRVVPILLVALLVACGAMAADAPKASASKPEITMPSLFVDHMVLQRDLAVPVWGKTAPNTKVSVTVGGQTEKTKSDKDGNWKVSLKPMKANLAPTQIVIKARKSKAIINDVLVGDVWVCSGQSNMEWPTSLINNPEEELKNANYPAIRLFTVTKNIAGQPLTGCQGKWNPCTSESVKGFSAVGYCFGRQLHKTLNVPVGLINTSWGGTPVEAWTSTPALQANPDAAAILKRWDEKMAKYPEEKAAFDKALAEKEKTQKDVYDKEMAEWQANVNAAKAANQIIMPKKKGEPAGAEDSWRPAGLYNAMIAPLLPYGIKGAIWYQGESNAGRAYQYRSLMPGMISDWRKNWGQGDFPFFMVQLANFIAKSDDANGNSPWAELREAQTRTLSLKNTGMAVTIDIGNPTDIHPRDKQDVGLRLAMSAFKVAYGLDWVDQGPMYQSLKVDGANARVKFTDADGGLKNNNGNGPLRGFTVAGEDKKFYPAEAKIEGDEVVVSAKEVAKPVAVRYGWADNPVCDLYNGANLPASPFRTDDWPGVTVDAR